MDYVGIAAAGLLVLVWAIYPLAVAVAARVVSRRGRSRWPELPQVSVIIATRESDAIIEARIRNCIDTSYPHHLLEVVVGRDRLVADSSVEVHTSARIIEVESDIPGGKASALNAAVRSATGEILIFADSHQEFRPETIPQLVDVLADPRIGAVSGQLEIPTSSVAARYWAYERWLRRNEAGVHSTIGVTGAVYGMRRPLWEPLPTGLILDDVFTPMKIILAGYRIAFAEAATAIETRKPTPRQEYARKVRTLTGVLQLCVWLPSLLVPWKNPVWLQFVFHKLLRLFTPYALALVGLWLIVSTIRLPGHVFTIVLLTILLASVWLARSELPLARRLRAAASEMALLQLATVRASMNGLRGRWGVWDV